MTVDLCPACGAYWDCECQRSVETEAEAMMRIRVEHAVAHMRPYYDAILKRSVAELLDNR